jgi:putative oligomerization/nucleic acid binding protein
LRYRVMTLLAVVVFVGSVYLFCANLTALLDTGTCASGGPYVSARPCPEGTGTSVLLLTGSIFGLFAAAGLAGLRGPRPGGGGFDFGAMMLAGWALFFSVTGAVALIHSLTSDVVGEDGKLGGIIVGATFLLMGLPVLLFTLPGTIRRAFRTARGTPSAETVYADNSGVAGWATTMRMGSQLMTDLSQATESRGATASSSWGTASSGGGSGAETISQLERLQKLREAGALTEAEFAAEKQRILRG